MAYYICAENALGVNLSFKKAVNNSLVLPGVHMIYKISRE